MPIIVCPGGLHMRDEQNVFYIHVYVWYQLLTAEHITPENVRETAGRQRLHSRLHIRSYSPKRHIHALFSVIYIFSY